ncbi:MAG: phosphoribosylamine--glycine ligase [Actinobacteria bacterium]|nr:phosphoribosylamine--glycine ligase [Actinomycetota bacterium]
MRVLVIGSGGRESALAWALTRSPSVTSVFAAPGNPGIARIAEVLDVDASSPAAAVEAARTMNADLVVVGPEAPLVAGVGDALRRDGFKVFGPNANAAHIEGSKAYAKELMDRGGVPTARWQAFDEVDKAVGFMDELGPPYVVKADGLAAGKGVLVASERDEAVEAVRDRIERRVFGDAGASVVIEEFLDGEETSLIAFTDGEAVVGCEVAQDYKRAFDDDAGPNTGGMGSYSPVPVCPPETADRILSEIIEPMVRTTADAGAPFVGALYAGLALTSRGPRVVEFNARFGDPETQALLPRLRSDFGEVLLATATGELSGSRLEWSPRSCVSVVLASAGYPGSYDTGAEISGLDEVEARDDVVVFHAGTAVEGERLVTAGGRVLAVSALGIDFVAARERAYEATNGITFEGKHQRFDIGLRAAEVSS